MTEFDPRHARPVPECAPPERVLVRYAEIALKRGNRRMFERALARNLRAAVRPISEVRFEQSHGRLTLVPERRTREVARRASQVFGVKSTSPVWGAETTPESILAIAHAVFSDTLADLPEGRSVPFRVRTKRADKRFPMASMDFDRWIADRILPLSDDRLRVDLGSAELELGIELREERSYVFLQRHEGHGGLPVGTLGRALCLLSGGIDSPVAAWMTMKRGCEVGYVSFHSEPYLGESSRKKIRDLVRTLSPWQPRSRLAVVPFAPTQEAIRDSAPEPYRTVLYRRMMQRIAAELAADHGYGALVTGESLGQVASQTLENMACIGQAASTLETSEEPGKAVMIVRPLVGFDKEDTIKIARRIGTFDVSNRAEPDCCSVFQPRRPIIRGSLEDCLSAERCFDVAGLVRNAVAGTEFVTLDEPSSAAEDG